MALSDLDYGEIREILYKPGCGKEELKAHPALPNKSQLKAAFQVVEDLWENNKAVVKTAIDLAMGVTTTNAEAKKIGLAWLIWKASKGG